MADDFQKIIYYHFDDDSVIIRDAIKERVESLEGDKGSHFFVYISENGVLNKIFNDSSDIANIQWTAWSDNYVYFPMYKPWSICWVGYAPRNPSVFVMSANCENQV